jgi:predicted nuclease with TOPRIM domain
MAMDPTPDVLRWVREGEYLFREVLQSLQQTDMLATENARLRQEVQALREELDALKAERAEVAETLKTFAEHVTRVATIGIQRLGKRPG